MIHSCFGLVRIAFSFQNNLFEQTKLMVRINHQVDQLNTEAKQNEESKNQLSDELKQLRQQLDDKLKEINKIKSNENEKDATATAGGTKQHDEIGADELKLSAKKTENVADDTCKTELDMEAIKNLTDADKLLRDEYKLLKGELDQRNEMISKMQEELQTNFSSTNELRKLLDIKETRIKELMDSEVTLNAKLTDSDSKIAELNKKVQEYDTSMKKLKDDLDFKLNLEKDLRTDRQQMTDKLTNMNAQLRDKMCEIEFLNKENNLLQERVNGEDERFKAVQNELDEAKASSDRLTKEVQAKKAEIERIENIVRKKEAEIGDLNQRLLKKEFLAKDKLEESERSRKELQTLQDKYASLSSTLDNKVNSLNTEIERLNKDKEKLFQDLVDLKTKHTSCNVTNRKYTAKAKEPQEPSSHRFFLVKQLNRTLRTRLTTRRLFYRSWRSRQPMPNMRTRSSTWRWRSTLCGLRFENFSKKRRSKTRCSKKINCWSRR